MSAAVLSDRVRFEVSDGVAVLELRHPEKRNAVTGPMWEAILGHLAAAADREDVRVLVVQGSGGAFCAGADLSSMKHPDSWVSESFRELAIRALKAVAAFPVPSVALIKGACIGAGCSLAMACDLRFACPDAFFAIPAVRHGIVYDTDSITRLEALVGPSRAARFLYTADRLKAEEAMAIGLVDECSDEVDRLVATFAEKVMQGNRSAIAANRTILRHQSFTA
ncbi:Enoyl-CoA hydratase [Rhodococcus wratislaviensis]|uniref:Enoyl-CoA hydratase n=1 Tax=Rhodococcus wratislaviensis TaxID=44752 RepID=A0A402C5F9_RHOWR|nr:enoyl-CoA hydratase/isomerase family protein [Rhodococcus wratislaviensis]GCE38860.1 Enoyl-CoA hydratase [Rhodococcus wratislaviensis]